LLAGEVHRAGVRAGAGGIHAVAEGKAGDCLADNAIHCSSGALGGEPAADAGIVIACAEIIVTRFGVAILALEFVEDCAGVGDRPFPSERIEIRIIERAGGEFLRRTARRMLTSELVRKFVRGAAKDRRVENAC
jgi:hypothetical protein